MKNWVSDFLFHQTWMKFSFAIPVGPLFWATVAAPFIFLVLVSFVLRGLRSRGGHAVDVELIDAVDDKWRTIILGTSAAQSIIDENAHSGSTYNVMMQVGWRQASANVEVQNIGEKAKLTSQMAKRLRIKFADAKPSSAKFSTTFPFLRPDLWTFRHPNSDVRLQWRIGAFYFVLGAILPPLILKLL